MPALVKFIGNVPASGKAKGGALRHRGWRATIGFPAEVEFEAGSRRPGSGRNRSGVSACPVIPSASISGPPTAPSRSGNRRTSGGCQRGRDPAADQRERGRRRTAAALVPLYARREGFPARRDALPWDSDSRVHRRQASRNGAAPRFPAAWSLPPRAGSRIRRSTALPPCFRGKRPKASTRISPVDASAEYLQASPRRLGARTSRRAIRPIRKFWSPSPPRSTPSPAN